MTDNGHNSADLGTKRLRLGLVIAALAVAILVIGFLGRDVVRKLDALETAQSDNVQWTLSRLEVERLQLLATVGTASRAPDAGLADVRRRFDVFYSRFKIIRSGEAYALLRADEALRPAFQTIAEFLDSTVPLIDGPDADLRAGLPDLLAQTQALGAPIQSILLGGLAKFAESGDQQRAEISQTLTQAIFATIALLLVMSVMVFFLLRSGRVSDARARRLEAISSRLSTMISTSLDAILVADTDGRVLEFNGAAEKIFGFTRDEAVGEKMGDLIIPDHHVAAHDAGMKRYLTTGERRVLGKGRVQLEAKRKSGDLFPVELSISSAMTPEGEVFVSYLRDISARKAAEAEVLKSRDEALAGERAKAKFMAIMSHEMRTPLNGIIGALELIRTSDLTETQRQYLRMMEFSGKRLLEHVNDVLDISRIEAEQEAETVQPMNLGETLAACIDSQSSSAQVVGNTMELDLLTPLPPVLMGDPKKLRRIILNLLGNANKFTKRGRITLEAEITDETETEVMVELRVADTGIGISEEDQARVFEDFVTLDSGYNRTHGGTGLGLGITRRLVKSLGGEIGLESEPGMGSVFWVRLPFGVASDIVADRAQERRHEADGFAEGSPAAVRIAPLKVLVVEDNEINQIVAERMLEADGHQVTIASDGADGIVLAGQERFDVIFMDISMPKVDGITATHRIREGEGLSRHTPIVALTAHTMPEDVAAFQEAGMNDYLSKPLTRDRLRKVIAGMGFPEIDDSDGPAPEIPIATLTELFGAEKAAALSGQFSEQIAAMVPRLTPEVFADERAEVLAELHKLKGSAGVFDMPDLVKTIAAAEARLKKDDLDALPGLARRLGRYVSAH